MNNDFYLVVGDGCDKPEWVCESNVDDVPNFGIKLVQNGSDGINICELRDGLGSKLIGKFHLLYDTELYDFNIQTCYNKNDHEWHFTVQDNKVKIRAILETCLQNLDNNAVKIFDFNDLITKIPEGEIQLALKDFERQHRYYPYYGIVLDKYWIIEWILPHEDLHRQDYEREAIDVAAKEFKKRFKEMWKPTCDDFKTIFHSNLNELKQQGERQYTGILKGKNKNDKKSFTFWLQKRYNDFISRNSYEWEWKDTYGRTLWIITPYYEDFVQIRLWNTIEKYEHELKRRLN
ncbi:MAG: hypothetical protein HUU44_06485 [Ignavibacteriaceae bacterium]|nr:hypothetical protein [Ignavibacteriaceae bacterium]